MRAVAAAASADTCAAVIDALAAAPAARTATDAAVSTTLTTTQPESMHVPAHSATVLAHRFNRFSPFSAARRYYAYTTSARGTR
jgi:hypothetical protein